MTIESYSFRPIDFEPIVQEIVIWLTPSLDRTSKPSCFCWEQQQKVHQVAKMEEFHVVVSSESNQAPESQRWRCENWDIQCITRSTAVNLMCLIVFNIVQFYNFMFHICLIVFLFNFMFNDI